PIALDAHKPGYRVAGDGVTGLSPGEFAPMGFQSFDPNAGLSESEAAYQAMKRRQQDAWRSPARAAGDSEHIAEITRDEAIREQRAKAHDRATVTADGLEKIREQTLEAQRARLESAWKGAA